MAKGGYFYDTSGVARKLKKGYFYDSTGVARKIKKGYRFDASGVARPCWSGGELAYYGTVTGLSLARYRLSAASNGSYALFAGGDNDDGKTNRVDAYSSSLVRSTPQVTGSNGLERAGVSLGDYAVFSYGYNADINIYDKTLTRHYLNHGWYIGSPGGATAGNYAVFAGGWDYDADDGEGWYTSNVLAVSKSLTCSVATSLSLARDELAGASIGGYALFAGGVYGAETTMSNRVDAYDASLTRTTRTSLSTARRMLKGAANAKYALFAGGNTGISSTAATKVDAYNTSLTRSTATALSVRTNRHTATTLDKYVLVGGGSQDAMGGTLNAAVWAYDESLTRTIPTAMSEARAFIAATSVGNYALFGGGYSNKSSYCSTVEAYTIA